MFSGIASLKPTAGRLPQSGQGSDGGLLGVVTVKNSLGFMSRSVKALEACMSRVLSEATCRQISTDPRFLPIPWRAGLRDRKDCLKIGW